jgi:hypothetical protein
MYSNKVPIIALVALSLCGTASARRSVAVDTWQSAPPSAAGSGPPVGTSLVFNSTTTLASGSLPSWLTSLVITPTSSGEQIGGVPQVQNASSLPNGNMWSFLSTGDDGQLYGAQVALYPTANTLTIDLNYAAPSCSGPGQAASFSINGLGYSASNPCAGGSPAVSPEDDEYNQSQFIFGLNSAGKLGLEDGVPKGWSVASAPEIDPRGFPGEIALLAGCLAVARSSRRTVRRAASAS